MFARRKSRVILLGDISIGGSNPIVIQSMTNTKTCDVKNTSAQIRKLYQAGCEIVRLAVPDQNAADALPVIIRKSPVPLIADIHFDLKLAHLAIENGAAKLRINPGNIKDKKGLKILIQKARGYKVPIRVGVNAGSLARASVRKYGWASSLALVDSAVSYINYFEQNDFRDLVISLKASDVYSTILSYRMIAEKTDYPLHLGVTAAGPLKSGIIKGSIGIGSLLADGLGDTIRVSLTAPPVEEVKAAKMILQSLGLRIFGPELISCPTCGRCQIDLVGLVLAVEDILSPMEKNFKIAVMGCVVNGPGEAREADLGLSAGKKSGILFKKGKVIKTVPLKDLLTVFREEIRKLN